MNIQWSEKVKEKLSKGEEEKKIIANEKEMKRLNLLESLKMLGGPFTNADEVDEFLKENTVNDKEKQQRMKKEIQLQETVP